MLVNSLPHAGPPQNAQDSNTPPVIQPDEADKQLQHHSLTTEAPAVKHFSAGTRQEATFRDSLHFAHCTDAPVTHNRVQHNSKSGSEFLPQWIHCHQEPASRHAANCLQRSAAPPPPRLPTHSPTHNSTVPHATPETSNHSQRGISTARAKLQTSAKRFTPVPSDARAAPQQQQIATKALVATDLCRSTRQEHPSSVHSLPSTTSTAAAAATATAWNQQLASASIGARKRSRAGCDENLSSSEDEVPIHKPHRILRDPQTFDYTRQLYPSFAPHSQQPRVAETGGTSEQQHHANMHARKLPEGEKDDDVIPHSTAAQSPQSTDGGQLAGMLQNMSEEERKTFESLRALSSDFRENGQFSLQCLQAHVPVIGSASTGGEGQAVREYKKSVQEVFGFLGAYDSKLQPVLKKVAMLLGLLKCMSNDRMMHTLDESGNAVSETIHECLTNLIEAAREVNPRRISSIKFD